MDFRAWETFSLGFLPPSKQNQTRALGALIGSNFTSRSDHSSSNTPLKHIDDVMCWCQYSYGCRCCSFDISDIIVMTVMKGEVRNRKQQIYHYIDIERKLSHP